MAIGVSSVTVNSRVEIDVKFDNDYKDSTVDEPTEWVVDPVNFAADVAVYSVSLIASDTVRLTLHPELTPGSKYNVQATSATDQQGNGANPDNLDFTPATSLAETSPEAAGRKMIEAYTQMMGDEFGGLHGRLATRLVAPLTENDSRCHVESALGFPDSGAFFSDGIRFSYTSRDEATLFGLSRGRPQTRTIPVRTDVELDETSVPPGEP